MNIVKAAAKVLLSVEEHGNKALTEFRMNQCRGCDKFNEETQQCGICGCYMDVKTTLATNRNPEKFGRIEITHCPTGNWGDAVIANIYKELN